ncbi:MAG: HAD family hydrolase [Bacteroidaceae bacterium]|nr:HAD family hydrolase [Bacteroidaceae bacterium]
MTRNKLQHIKLLAIDADDTLWDNQTHFDTAQDLYCKLLAPWADEQAIRNSLYKVECRNMPLTGYGTKAFILSMIENAIGMTDSKIPAEAIQKILDIGMDILNMSAKPFPGVRETLAELFNSGKYKIVCFTKGDAIEQEEKFMKSGLTDVFHDIYVTSDKDDKEFERLCFYNGVKPSEMVSIGNSFKSDIHPIVTLGGYGIHIPYKRMWQYEHTEEYQHDHVIQVRQFSDILNYL